MRKIKPEADGILKDGQMLRVPHTMMDAASQKELADKFAPKPFVADHHRPRSATLTDEQRNAAIERQKAFDKRLSDAWRNPQSMFVPQNVATTPPEVLKPIAFGEARQVHDAAGLDALQAANERRHAAKLSEMWRHPTNHGVK